MLQEKAKDSILVLIEKERDGDQIDRTLLKNVLSIFIEVGMGGMDTYQKDFEVFLLTETALFYKRKAAAWIQVPLFLISHLCRQSLSGAALKLPVLSSKPDAQSAACAHTTRSVASREWKELRRLPPLAMEPGKTGSATFLALIASEGRSCSAATLVMCAGRRTRAPTT